jgi:hypothetical protein
METRFLGLIIDDTLSWKQHTKQIVNKIAIACYALRNIKHIVSIETLRLIYFAQIHSVMSYGIIFWCGSISAHKVFIMQTKPRDSCRKIFEMMRIMTLYS